MTEFHKKPEIIRVENDAGQWRTVVIDRLGTSPWQVYAVAIPGYVHAAALREFVEAVFYGLGQHDIQVELVTDIAGLTEKSIIIGAHLLNAEQCQRVPAGAIVYNSEHIGSYWFQPHYTELLRRVIVWDYSSDNARALETLLSRKIIWVPLGYVPQFTRIKKQVEDIDVLFFGSHGPRRSVILDDLRDRGLSVHHAFGVYGRDRDEWIARSKVVLNIHQYIPGAFEIVRVAYLLANRKAVVSELNIGETADPDLFDAIATAPYEQMADMTMSLVHDPQRRQMFEKKGFESFSRRHEAVILSESIARSGKILI